MRINLGERVVQAVNVKKGSNIYSDLVFFDVNVEEVFVECVYLKVRSSINKINKFFLQELDIMVFFLEDFEIQIVYFDQELFQREDLLLELLVVLIFYVFDLYEYIQCW